MWSTRKSMLLIFLATAAAPQVRASDLLDQIDIKLWIRPSKLSKPRERARQYLQTKPDLHLSDASKQFASPRVGLVYWRERAAGDKVLLSASYEGVNGWATATEVVPLTEAESFFSRSLVDHPRDSFAFLMRGIVRYENDQLDLAFADLNESLHHNPKCIPASLPGLIFGR